MLLLVLVGVAMASAMATVLTTTWYHGVYVATFGNATSDDQQSDSTKVGRMSVLGLLVALGLFLVSFSSLVYVMFVMVVRVHAAFVPPVHGVAVEQARPVAPAHEVEAAVVSS